MAEPPPASEQANSMDPFRRAFERVMAMAQTDPEVAGAIPVPASMEAMRKPGLSYPEIIATALELNGPKPAMRSRSSEIRRGPDGKNRRHWLPAFDTLTYSDAKSRVEAIASAWRHHPEHHLLSDEFACFIAFTGAEMVLADMACAYAQVIAVPLQANLPSADMMDVLRDTEPAALLASLDNLDLAVGYALDVPSVRSLVVLDYDPRDDDERQCFEAALARLAEQGSSIALASLGELIEFGSRQTWQHLPPRPAGPDAMAMLMYTSGSTGTPKGAIIHEAMCAELWTGAPPLPSIQMVYAPLNHFMGRTTVFNTLATGGIACFTLKSDMSTLFEDIRLARPTFLIFMPRLAEIIYQQFLSEVERRVAEGEERLVAEAAVKAAMAAETLGDRLVAGGVGSAPTSPEVRNFLADCFGIAFSNGYSSTEASSSALMTNGQVLRNVVLDYKLLDVPELGYFSTDKPYPRGEFLVKSRLAIKGYFNRPEATASIFDSEGWLHTGDIMAEIGPDRLEWVDRRNNVIKLAQGEYVAIGPLEATFLGHGKLIRQIYIYGNSYRSYLLAVVVPDVDVARSRSGHEPSREELRELVLADFQEAARAAGLKAFEIPRDVVIELEPFSLENGLLSSVRKPLRPKLKERYQAALEAIYEEMEQQQRSELARLREGEGRLSTAERVAGAIRATLGLGVLDAGSSQSFTDLGGDSLAAVSLSLLLEEIFGLEVPANVILGPTGTVMHIASFIDAQSSSSRATFASVHGADAAELRAADLSLDAFLDPLTIEAAHATGTLAHETRTVLLTGATGFLGRFLCLEWLQHFAQRQGGKVICLVRGSSQGDAQARLNQAFGSLDKELADRFEHLATAHLEVLPADLASPNLGLAEQVHARLAEEVDQIVHPGALVNHMLSYRDLFGPNVAGTAQLIQLAVSKRQKRFDFVSTFGVPQVHPGLRERGEDADVREMAPRMPLGEGYALGYNASKWASEVLLRNAHEQFGLPVTVYRPDMILAHSRYSGQINVPDMFTRLLFSVAVTGMAPGSFYDRQSSSARPQVHYDGLPVDFLAAAIQQLGAQAWSGFRCFNTVSTSLDDGISLDWIADWLESAGYPLARLKDHADWLHSMEQRLRSLPADQRQYSALPILQHFSSPLPSQSPAVPSDRFTEALRDLPAGPGIPGISEAFIHKFVKDMQLLGILNPIPGRS